MAALSYDKQDILPLVQLRGPRTGRSCPPITST